MALPNGSSEKVTVLRKLEEIGCCDLCCLRFLGETCPGPYKEKAKALKCRDNSEEQSSKILKKNPCIACLGLLQTPSCDTIMQNVLDEINTGDYDCDSFNVAITLPVVYQLRAHSLYLFVDETFPSFSQTTFPIGCVTVGVKDVWKWLFTSFIEERIGKKYDVNSDFFVGITVAYQDNDVECACLYNMLPAMFSKKQTKLRHHSGQELFSRKAVEQSLKTITANDFSKHYSNPPQIPTQLAVCGSVNLEHKSIFVAGRYNKWSRQLPQTPWIIGGERKMESSVEELINAPLETISKSQGSKFSASGREDVDVRTLGRGRPFCVELLNPKRVKFDFDTMRSLENEINANGSKNIFVRDLQVVSSRKQSNLNSYIPVSVFFCWSNGGLLNGLQSYESNQQKKTDSRDSLINLKMGEEHKTKEYNAYCIVYGPLPPELDRLANKGPVTLSQMTPIRVLHRRPVASRERTINWFKTKPVSQGKTPQDPSYFTLTMNTQAGTYIKEFIHGDLGRTTPSLGDLLDGASVDILALDVQEIALDWPPEVEYSCTKVDSKSV